MDTDFEIIHEIRSDRVHWYSITNGDQPISFGSALRLWQDNRAFRICFDSILVNDPFSAYRWETPPITNTTINRHFEFVLLDSPGLERAPDKKTYADYFTDDGDAGADSGVVVFDNLGKDAILVVPSPLNRSSAYGHLAAFLRSAPEYQRHAFWRVVGRTAEQAVTERPLWISTAGDGVAWLHVRLDSYPKYYGHGAYREDR